MAIRSTPYSTVVKAINGGKRIGGDTFSSDGGLEFGMVVYNSELI